MQLASTVLYTDDLPRAVDFYKRAFGCQLRFLDLDVKLPGRQSEESYQFAILSAGTAELHLASHPLGSLMMPGYTRPAEGGPRGVEIAFYTEDIRASFDRAVAAGAVPISQPERMPWGQHVSYVRGVDGIFICICERPHNELPNEEL